MYSVYKKWNKLMADQTVFCFRLPSSQALPAITQQQTACVLTMAATINRLISIIKIIEWLIEIASLQHDKSSTNQASSLRKVEMRYIHQKYNFIAGQIVSNFRASEYYW